MDTPKSDTLSYIVTKTIRQFCFHWADLLTVIDCHIVQVSIKKFELIN